ncbi:hypothetical protein MTO96_009880 [Rhipicephalus appendiculatus]
MSRAGFAQVVGILTRFVNSRGAVWVRYSGAGGFVEGLARASGRGGGPATPLLDFNLTGDSTSADRNWMSDLQDGGTPSRMWKSESGRRARIAAAWLLADSSTCVRALFVYRDIVDFCPFNNRSRRVALRGTHLVRPFGERRANSARVTRGRGDEEAKRLAKEACTFFQSGRPGDHTRRNAAPKHGKVPHHHVDASLGAHLGSGRTEAGILESAQGANQAVERAAGNYTFNAAGWEQGNHALLPLGSEGSPREAAWP